MKFRTAGSGSAAKTAETSPNRADGGKAASSVSRNEVATAPTAVPLRPTAIATDAVSAAKELNRRSLEAVSPSPRNGRPTNVKPLNTTSVNNETLNLAFQVPDTPPRNSGLGKHLLPNAKGFSLDEPDDVKNSGKNSVPFPFVEDDEARHQICQDSLTPWTYLLAIPGKNVRDILIDAFNDWLKVSPANLAVIKQVVGYLHTGSLIIDDIEDESMTRRGEPAAHVMYGTARALNAGNYVYFLAMEKVLTLQSTECVMVFTSEMLNLHRGQGRDIFWRSTRYVATEEEYRHMVCDKTGGLFRLAIRFMQLLSSTTETRFARMAASSSFSECSVPGTPTVRLMSPSVYTATSDFTALADQMACYFQVRDDLINLASPKFHQKKGFCEDITEGKLSFIALHALRTYKAQNKTQEIEELFEILMSKTEDKVKIKRALTLMDNTGAFDHTVAYLNKLHKDIEESITSFGKNPALSKLMTMIASEVDDCYDVKKRVIEA